MKKYLLTAVCIIMMSMTASAVSINKALLDHNGEVTLFDGNKIQDAIDAAEDGDVIYLTLGTFKPFKVTKSITIKGTGEKSVIDGDVIISIPNNSTLSNPVMEALAVSGSVNVTAPLTNLVVRQCKVTSSFGIEAEVIGGTIERCKIGTMSFTGIIQNLTIDRCNVSNGFALSSTIESMTVMNSYVIGLSAKSGATNNTTFVNCNLYFSSTNNFSGTIINSVVKHWDDCVFGITTLYSTVLVNSLINTSYTFKTNNTTSLYYMIIGTNCVQENCYTESSNSLYTYANYLQEKGYLGTDGTVVGMYGGDTPYDDNMLVPLVPKVTSSDIKLDKENKVLNVKLTVSPQ